MPTHHDGNTAPTSGNRPAARDGFHTDLAADLSRGLGRLLSRVTTAPAEVLSAPRNARKLTAADVRLIRKGRGEGLSREGLAKTFGVTASTIDHIVSGHTWKSVPR